LWTNARERREVEDLQALCHRVVAVPLPTWRSLVSCVRGLGGPEPLQTWYSASDALNREVAKLSLSADLVHIEHLRGARYAAAIAPDRPIVWDSVDCITDLFAKALQRRRDRLGRWITRIELSRTRTFEAAAIARFDHVVVTSPADRASLLRLSHAEEDAISVVTMGVDLEYFAPPDTPRQRDTIVFSGKMSYHANESAVLHLIRNVMPLIWNRRPSVNLMIVGKDPSRTLRGAASSLGSRVALTGTVPDMRPYLGRAAIAVVPLVYGAGCQIKVIESMACGTPVVASSQAVSALQARIGEDVLVADEAGAFAGAVLDLLDDPVRQRRIGEAGRRYVETHHQWDRITEVLEAVYRRALARRSEWRAVESSRDFAHVRYA
jgi:glycosyltransferase involved in cell wall biosynthesis